MDAGEALPLAEAAAAPLGLPRSEAPPRPATVPRPPNPVLTLVGVTAGDLLGGAAGLDLVTAVDTLIGAGTVFNFAAVMVRPLRGGGAADGCGV